MTDERAFIETIREHPEDDGPRLVYADWLEERGDCERAEFIRVQIELAKGVRDRKRLRELLCRENDWIAKNAVSWPSTRMGITGRTVFRRGVIESLYMTAREFLDNGETILRHPVMYLSLRGIG